VGNGEENDDCGESFFEGFHDDDASSIITASHGQLTVVGNADVRLTKETRFHNSHILTVANSQDLKVSLCRFLLGYLNILPPSNQNPEDKFPHNVVTAAQTHTYNAYRRASPLDQGSNCHARLLISQG